MLSLVASACAQGQPQPEISSGSFAGNTDQHLRVVAVVDENAVRLTMRAHCSITSGAHYLSPRPLTLDRDLVAPIAADGTFQIADEFVVGATDGDESRVRVRVVGRVIGNGVTGRLDATERLYNGQLGRVDATCRASKVDFEALESVTRPVVAATAPIAEADLLLPVPEGLIVLDERYQVAGDKAELHLVGSGGDIGGRVTLAAAGGSPSDNASFRTVAVFDASAVWAVGATNTGSQIERVLQRYDVASGRLVAESVIRPVGVAVGAGALWVTPDHASRFSLEKRDVLSGELVRSIPVPFRGRLAAADDVVYVVGDRRVAIVDPTSLTIEHTVDLPDALHDFVPATTGLWIWDAATLRHVSPTGDTTKVKLPDLITGVAPDEDGAWVSLSRQKVLARVEGRRVARTLDLAQAVTEIAYDGLGQLWGAGASGVLRLEVPSRTTPDNYRPLL